MSQATGRRNALPFIFVVVLLDMVGVGLIMPVMPGLIEELTGKSVVSAASIGGWLAFAHASMQLLFAPVIGGLSDRFGRRPVLLGALFAFGLDYALCGFAPSLAWLFLGRLIAGITGASYTTAYACVADITPPEKRAQSFGLLGAAFGIGFIVGPAIGGALGGLGSRAPFFVAAAVALLNCLYGYFFLEESLPTEKRRPFEVKHANPIGTFLQVSRRHPAQFGYLMASGLFNLSMQSVMLWSFYTKERFGWSTRAIGASLAAVGVIALVVQGWGTRWIIPWLGERRAVVIGLISTALALITYGLAPTTWVLYLGILISAPGDLAYPSLTALMSQRVSEDAQGELQGAIASLTGLATVIGPPFFAEIFTYFSRPGAPVYLPGAPMFLGAVMVLAALGFFLRSRDPAPAR